MEKSLFEIHHRLSEEILFELYSLTTPLKKKTLAFRILACWFIGIAVSCFIDDAPYLGTFSTILAIFLLFYLCNIKKCVLKHYKRDANIFKDRCLYLYDDHLALESVLGLSTTDYSKMHKMVEGKHGMYLFLSEISAICIPKEALTPESLAFLRSKV